MSPYLGVFPLVLRALHIYIYIDRYLEIKRDGSLFNEKMGTTEHHLSHRPFVFVFT